MRTEEGAEIRVLVARIKEERKILKDFMVDFNQIKDYNPRDNRLAGFSYAINCHKKLIDDLQAEIDRINAEKGYGRKERRV
jgi:hypothetical protein